VAHDRLGIFRAYSAFAEGGAELGITPATLARVTEPPELEGALDEVLGVPSSFAVGFLRPGPEGSFGSSPRAFGSPGAGGSFGFADPDQRLGYAYVMNRLDFYLQNDPREKPLRDAVHRAHRARRLHRIESSPFGLHWPELEEDSRFADLGRRLRSAAHQPA